MSHPHLEISADGKPTLLMAHEYDYRGLIEWLEDGAYHGGDHAARMAAQVIASMSRELRTIDKKLAEPEVELRVELPSPPMEMPVPHAQINSLRTWRRYLHDPMEFAAERQGADVDQYRRWVNSDGWPHCGATGIDGKRCRNIVSGAQPSTFREWRRLDGKPCRDHGGKPWQVLPEDDPEFLRRAYQPPKENFMTPHDLSEEQIALVKTYAGNVEGLVAAASDDTSILHDLFDWSGNDLSSVDNRRKAAEALITSASEADPAPAAPDGAETETDKAPASEAGAEDTDSAKQGE
jgi:hypothetical protein